MILCLTLFLFDGKVESSLVDDESVDAGEDLDGILFFLMVLIDCFSWQDSYPVWILLTEHVNDEEEGEGIPLQQQLYPWEGTDRDYLYEEVCIS